MPKSIPPQLPSGDVSAYSTLSQSFSFHSSPESFISSQDSTAASKTSDSIEASTVPPRVIRAKILNRTVAIIPSYQSCKDILRAGNDEPQESIFAAHPGESIGPSTFVVRPAYRELMEDFFPSPNILLEDYPSHTTSKASWRAHLSSFPTDISSSVREIVKDHISTWTPSTPPFDLYESMKICSWRLLLGAFLQLTPTSKSFAIIESLQETLLRGQFSLFPVSITTPFWRSPRAKGIEARKKLQVLLKEYVLSQAKEHDRKSPETTAQCPLLRHCPQTGLTPEIIASHALLFTSSIATKALASLLTATLLNLFLQPVPSYGNLASRVRAEAQESPENARLLLQSILLETERLSPPVIGVMRRLTQPVVLANPRQDEPDYLIPAGWDVWCYFTGASRDAAAYHLPDTFVPERFVSESERDEKPGFGFGGGEKTCLGRVIARGMVMTVAEMLVLESDTVLEGEVEKRGVRGWLGWETGVRPEEFARELKQLPCQRPKEEVRIRVVRM